MNKQLPVVDAAGSAEISPLGLQARQRSHVLFVLSNSQPGQEAAYVEWFRGDCHRAIASSRKVLKAQHYEQDEVDITRGRYPRLMFQYLGVYELSLDGAEQAVEIIEQIEALHREQLSAQAPATWLYYPASEKVGRNPTRHPSMLAVAFANGLPGTEAEFREFYATRHIRHALNVQGLVSGQCFERTLFQRSRVHDASFATIAIYEHESSPESIIQSFQTLPEGTLKFPMLDRTPHRFCEWCYRPL